MNTPNSPFDDIFFLSPELAAALTAAAAHKRDQDRLNNENVNNIGNFNVGNFDIDSLSQKISRDYAYGIDCLDDDYSDCFNNGFNDLDDIEENNDMENSNEIEWG